MPPKILVLGSSNVDLILRVPRFHRAGETIKAESLVTAFGGKGANQAVAAKRLGGDVCLITKLGHDHYGQSYRQYLIENGLPSRGILLDRKLPTGIALIELIEKGENRIIVSPGANGSFSEKELNGLSSLWKGVKVFVSQLEIPLETVWSGLKRAKEEGAVTLLNPSPPVRLPREILSLADFLIPNELEAQYLSGTKIRVKEDIAKAASKLIKMGARNVVITLGPQGLFFKSGKDEVRMEGFRLNAIDTTAAGDAFLGGFASALAKGKSIREALRFANGAGALATTRLGAQPSLPRRKELEIFLSRSPQRGVAAPKTMMDDRRETMDDEQ